MLRTSWKVNNTAADVRRAIVDRLTEIAVALRESAGMVRRSETSEKKASRGGNNYSAESAIRHQIIALENKTQQDLLSLREEYLDYDELLRGFPSEQPMPMDHEDVSFFFAPIPL